MSSVNSLQTRLKIVPNITKISPTSGTQKCKAKYTNLQSAESCMILSTKSMLMPKHETTKSPTIQDPPKKRNLGDKAFQIPMIPILPSTLPNCQSCWLPYFYNPLVLLPLSINPKKIQPYLHAPNDCHIKVNSKCHRETG